MRRGIEKRDRQTDKREVCDSEAETTLAASAQLDVSQCGAVPAASSCPPLASRSLVPRPLITTRRLPASASAASHRRPSRHRRRRRYGRRLDYCCNSIASRDTTAAQSVVYGAILFCVIEACTRVPVAGYGNGYPPRLATSGVVGKVAVRCWPPSSPM